MENNSSLLTILEVTPNFVFVSVFYFSVEQLVKFDEKSIKYPNIINNPMTVLLKVS